MKSRVFSFYSPLISNLKIFSLVKRHGKSLKLTYVTSIVFKQHHIRFQLNGTSSVRKLFSRQKLICRMFLVAESLFLVAESEATLKKLKF